MSNLIEGIYTSSLKLLVPTSPQTLYKTIIEEAVSLMKAKWGRLYLGNQGELKLVYDTIPIAHDSNIVARKRGFTYQTYITGKPRVISREEILKIHPESDKLIKSVIMIPIFYGNEPTGVLNLQSTHSMQRLSARQIHALQLYGSMGSLAIRKVQAQFEAQNALESRDLFIAMAAHELRTPLTVIKLYSQMLHKRFEAKDILEHTWAENLLKETNRTVHIVNELLHIDEIRTGNLKYSQDVHSLRKIIKNAIHDCEISYPHHNFTFEDNIQNQKDLIVGDNHKLVQAFINILNNAAKFSPLHSTIAVSLKLVSKGFEVIVTDQGAGIDQNEIKHIFDTFYKGKQNQTVEGMGLGLPLVKQIIEHSKGTITIHSHLNQGTKVNVILPKSV